jgi:hypothetical protein
MCLQRLGLVQLFRSSLCIVCDVCLVCELDLTLLDSIRTAKKKHYRGRTSVDDKTHRALNSFFF